MNGGEKFYLCSWWSCSHPKRTIFCLTILATDWDLSIHHKCKARDHGIRQVHPKVLLVWCNMQTQIAAPIDA